MRVANFLKYHDDDEKNKVKIEIFWQLVHCNLIDGKICGRTRMRRKNFQQLTL